MAECYSIRNTGLTHFDTDDKIVITRPGPQDSGFVVVRAKLSGIRKLAFRFWDRICKKGGVDGL